MKKRITKKKIKSHPIANLFFKSAKHWNTISLPLYSEIINDMLDYDVFEISNRLKMSPSKIKKLLNTNDKVNGSKKFDINLPRKTHLVFSQAVVHKNNF